MELLDIRTAKKRIPNSWRLVRVAVLNYSDAELAWGQFYIRSKSGHQETMNVPLPNFIKEGFTKKAVVCVEGKDVYIMELKKEMFIMNREDLKIDFGMMNAQLVSLDN